MKTNGCASLARSSVSRAQAPETVAGAAPARACSGATRTAPPTPRTHAAAGSRPAQRTASIATSNRTRTRVAFSVEAPTRRRVAHASAVLSYAQNQCGRQSRTVASSGAHGSAREAAVLGSASSHRRARRSPRVHLARRGDAQQRGVTGGEGENAWWEWRIAGERGDQHFRGPSIGDAGSVVQSQRRIRRTAVPSAGACRGSAEFGAGASARARTAPLIPLGRDGARHGDDGDAPSARRAPLSGERP